MQRAKRGLFEGRHIGFGNHVSFSKQHERRNWKPNVQFKRYESATLQQNTRLMVTTHTIRCIKKAGGLDQYLLSSPFVNDSYVGTVMKAKVLQKLAENPELPIPEKNKRTVSIPKSWRRVSTDA